MKPSDRIWELANERCVRQGISPTEVGLQDVGTYLDEQRELVIITAPECASEAQIGKMAESLAHLIERHDVVIVPFGTKVTRNGQVVHGMPQRIDTAVVPSPEAYRAAFGCDPEPATVPIMVRTLGSYEPTEEVDEP